MRGLFRLPPSRSGQVRLSLPRSIPTCRFSQVLPGSPRFSQVLPGSPRKLVISYDFVGFRDFLGEPGCYFLRFCGISGVSWEKLGVIFCVFVGFRDFLGEPGCYFLRFCGVSGISWENLGGNSWGWAWESCKSLFGENWLEGGPLFWPAIFKFLPQALPPPLACRFATL